MNLSEIKQTLAALNEVYSTPHAPEGLYDRVRRVYGQRVVAQLEAIFSADVVDLTQLTAFFKENWALVNGTLLSPTVSPNSELTGLLCGVAEFLAQQKSVNSIQVLMPSVNISSIADDYPDLTDLRLALQTHILGKDGLYLVPIKQLTGLDLSPGIQRLNNLYFDVFSGHPEETAYISPEEFTRLIEHSHLTRAVFDAKKAYEILVNDKSNLLGQLNELCRHLYINAAHGGRGTEADAAGGAYSAIAAFYQYYSQLSSDEIAKIPADLKSSIERFLDIATTRDKDKTAEQLIETCISNRRAELVGMMQRHEAALSEIGITGERKAELIKAAQEQFKCAQDELEKALANHTYTQGQDNLGVNKQLLEQLQMTMAVTSPGDLEMIKDLRTDEMTAFFSDATLREQIVSELRTLENLVIFILDLAPDKIDAFLRGLAAEIKRDFVRAPQDFSALLISLNIEKCQQVCAALDLPGMIQSASDLQSVLHYLLPEQCAVVLAALKEHLPGMIQSADNFEYVLRHLSPEQDVVVLEAFKERLPGIIQSARDLLNVLRYLLPEQIAVVFAALKERLPGMIQLAGDFEYVLAYLSPEQRAVMFAALKERLPELIQSTNDLQSVLRHLSPEQRAVVFAALKEPLPGMIQSARDLLNVMGYLSPEQRAVMFAAFEERLPELIQSTHDLQSVLRHLSPEQGIVVLEAIKKRLPDMIQSTDNLINVLGYLSPEQRAVVFEALKERLPGMIQSTGNLISVLSYLSPEQIAVVLEAFKERLPGMIQSTDDLQSVLEYLSPEQGIVVLEAIKKRLPDMIQSTINLRSVLSYLSPEQIAVVLEALKERLPGIIQSVNKLQSVLHILSPEQRAVVFAALKERLPGMIQSTSDFQSVLHYLLPEQCAVVFSDATLREQIVHELRTLENLVIFILDLAPDKIDAFLRGLAVEIKRDFVRTPQDFSALLFSLNIEKCQQVCAALDLQGMIQSANHLKFVLRYLTPEQCAVVLASLKDHLPGMVQSAYDFEYVLRYLSPELSAVVFTALKDHLPGMIQSIRDLQSVLGYLSAEHRAVVLEVLKKRLPGIIQSIRDLQSVLVYLSTEQITVMFAALKERLSEIIQSTDDLLNMLRYSSPEKITVVFEALKEHLPGMIQSNGDLLNVLLCLSPEQGVVMLEALKERLPGMVQSAYEFEYMLNDLSPEQRAVVFAALKEPLPGMIQSTNDLLNVLRYLSAEQGMVVLEALKERLPSMIRSNSEFSLLLNRLTPAQQTYLQEIMQPHELKLRLGDYIAPWLIDVAAQPLVQGAALVGASAAIAGLAKGWSAVLPAAMTTASLVTSYRLYITQERNHKSKDQQSVDEDLKPRPS